MKTILIDFDGVLHSYASGWQGADVVADDPVPGAIEFLHDLLWDERFSVCIYSSRSKEKAGLQAMRDWLLEHGFHQPLMAMLRFPVQKPAAYLTIDDRAICFDGSFPSLDEIDQFKPWNKR